MSERNRTIAMCSWEACEECGRYTDEAGCTYPYDLELITDGDSVLCMSSTDKADGHD